MFREYFVETISTHNTIVSLASGLLFWSGWWLLIWMLTDFRCHYEPEYVLPPAGATLAFAVINCLPHRAVSSEPDLLGAHDSKFWRCSRSLLRLVLFVGLMICFGSLIGIFYVLIAFYVKPEDVLRTPGWINFFATLFIFGAAVIFRLRRSQ